ELFDYSLVDPDNRRPVDFDLRRLLLAETEQWLAETGPPRLDGSGAAKLWLVRHALTVRRDQPQLFTGYQPLLADGPAAEHLVAFDRGGLIALATRLPLTLHQAGGWRTSALSLPAGEHRDLLTGQRHTGRLPVAALLESYPVALLVPA